METNTIGIGITTLERYDLFEDCIKNFVGYKTSNMKFIVVDDNSSESIILKKNKLCSDNSIKIINNAERKGINKVKNICLEYLDDCDYIFLFDDDIYPVVEDWYQPWINAYINTKIHFFDYCYDIHDDGSRLRNKIYNFVFKQTNLSMSKYPLGHMIFLTTHCLNCIGGMDPEYKLYGAEHIGLSKRAFNFGLTQNCIHVSLPDNIYDFYSMDRISMNNRSTMNNMDTTQLITNNSLLFEKNDMDSLDYKLYKKMDVFVVMYGGNEPKDLDKINTYVIKSDIFCIVLHDNLDKKIIIQYTNKFIKFVQTTNLQNFIIKYKEYINKITLFDIDGIV